VLRGIGTVNEPVPITGLAVNFSPIPRIAPPPFGKEMDGGAVNPEPLDCDVPGDDRWSVSLGVSCIEALPLSVVRMKPVGNIT